MNDSELKSILKGSRAPERPDEYWEEFPARVRVQLRRAAPRPAPRSGWRPGAAWAGSLAAVAVMTFISVEFQPLKAASSALTKDEQQLRSQVARLDSGLHHLLLNTDGMGYLLADAD